MIKINLVGERKRAVAAGPSRFKDLQAGTDVSLWILLGLVGLGLLITLGHLYILNGKINDKKDEVAEARLEYKELEPYIKEVQEFKAKKASLERKVQVINQLKTNQKGPVQIMDQVSRAVPELLWMTRMEVGTGSITVSGQAFNTNAVANFIENLDRVPEFQEPVLRDTSQRGEVYTFVVVFNYSYKPERPQETEEGEVVEG